MKLKIILLGLSLFLVANIGFAQKKKGDKSIISDNVSISKYHNKGDLERMQKGELLTLYIERIEVLVKILPYIAFTTKPGVTMTELGIPNNSDNRKALDNQFDAINDFLETSVEFQKQMLPYSDTKNLIAAILFYEETLKSLHLYREFD
ncbi:hypothetical protein ACS386_08285 [Flavobacteriaceae bacterium LMO-SS05]